MSLYLDRNGILRDERCPSDTIFLGAPLSVCYTWKTDDITTGPKPSATPYVDRADPIPLASGLPSKETATEIRTESYEDGVCLTIKSSRSDLSEYGLNLPLNFMGKRNGGGWQNQFLFNSPCLSSDKKIVYAYLTKPNGAHLMVAARGAVGWKMDYSPYLWAHYFVNLKLFSSYDRAYGREDGEKELTVALIPVESFSDGLEKLSRFFSLPLLDYAIGGGALGETVALTAYGEPDAVIAVHNGIERHLSNTEQYTLENDGETELIPVKNGIRGIGATVYAYPSAEELYRRSMLRVDLDVVRNYTDGNLCEHQCWCAAMLRFLSRYGSMLTPEEKTVMEAKTRGFLDILTETDAAKATPRQTIFHLPHEGYPAYNVFRSRRVQELFFGITILLDAYRYYGDEVYYRYAVGATDNLITNYQKEDGRLEIDWGNSREDYTTVCCAMIPLADMARFAESRCEERGKRYREAADRMAAYLYARGMHFPTEGGETKEAEEEMEEGSISCTALALLYYCKNIRRVDAYIEKAKEILDIHENWIIHTPICQMHGSTLRWWETQWEGDADGPAICAGHAWSIWRAEADYLYYSLTGDERYRRKAENGFLTNLSKAAPDGKCWSIYCPDPIPGGGFHRTSDEIRFRIAPHFSDREDSGISRYVWIRMNDTFLSDTEKRSSL